MQKRKSYSGQSVGKHGATVLMECHRSTVQYSAWKVSPFFLMQKSGRVVIVCERCMSQSGERVLKIGDSTSGEHTVSLEWRNGSGTQLFAWPVSCHIYPV